MDGFGTNREVSVRIYNKEEELIGVFYTENYEEMLKFLYRLKELETDICFNGDDPDDNIRWFKKYEDIFQPTSITDICVEFNPSWMPSIHVYVV